jgi:hypothetical protein
VRCLHLHGDPGGETHLTEIEFPIRETHAGVVQGVSEIPALTMGMGAFVERKPDVGMHQAPKRQFLVVLQGELELLTSLDQRELLHPGDVLLADDIGTKGHISRDVGNDRLMLMAIAIDPGWQLSP